MEPAHFRYSRRMLKLKLVNNAVLCSLFFAYAALIGLSYTFLDFVILFMLGISLYRLINTVFLMTAAPPIVTISDDGIADRHLGTLVPWSAIREIKVIKPRNSFGNGLLLMADAGSFRTIPGPVASRVANFLMGARPGRQGRTMGLFMTPAVVLDGSLDDLLGQIQARPGAAAIPIVPHKAE